MAGWLWVVWALEVLACILCLLRLFLVSARLLPFLLLACLLVGYLVRARPLRFLFLLPLLFLDTTWGVRWRTIETIVLSVFCLLRFLMILGWFVVPFVFGFRSFK